MKKPNSKARTKKTKSPNSGQPEKLICSEFQGKSVEVTFSRINLSGDAGSLLIREAELATGIMKRLSNCFTDNRDQLMVVHKLETQVRQRITGLLHGCPDHNDHDELCREPSFELLVDEPGIVREDCKPLGTRSTMRRLDEANRQVADGEQKKLEFNQDQHDYQLLEDSVEWIRRLKSKLLIIDMDATADQLYGNQVGGAWNGFYRYKCLLPLLAFVGPNPVYCRTRAGDVDGSLGTAEALNKIVPFYRQRFPEKLPIFRADGGFNRPELICTCHEMGLHFAIGLAKNDALMAQITPQIKRVKKSSLSSGKTKRVFTEFNWTTGNGSWGGQLFRVIAKVEYINTNNHRKLNVRFMVTNLDKKFGGARKLYTKLYCGRGDAENRIQENQYELFGSRVSAHNLEANQMRLNFAVCAHKVANAIRTIGFRDTKLASAKSSTIRRKILKTPAIIKHSCRRVWMDFSTEFASKDLFVQAIKRFMNYGSRRRGLTEGVG